jgi:hypothetical protein
MKSEIINSKPIENTYVICDICGENLGLDRPNWGVDHLKKYPSHRSYRSEMGK